VWDEDEEGEGGMRRREIRGRISEDRIMEEDLISVFF
jgi:hypothetical protein